MKRKREYVLILAITCLSWGVFFPDYTFTTDSYRIIMEENGNGSDMEMDGDIWIEDVQCETLGQSDAVQSAIRSGRVRYKWKFAEYIRSLFW